MGSNETIRRGGRPGGLKAAGKVAQDGVERELRADTAQDSPERREALARFFSGSRSIPLDALVLHAYKAHGVAMSKQRLSPIRSGTMIPNLEEIRSIARIFGVRQSRVVEASKAAVLKTFEGYEDAIATVDSVAGSGR